MEGMTVVGLRACFVGGNANNGANAGLAYVNSNNAVSNSNTNIGSRICGKNNTRRPATLPLGKTQQNNRGFGSIGEEDAQKQSIR